MLNLFRGRGQQQTQVKGNPNVTQLLPESALSGEALPSGIPAQGKVVVTISSQFGSGGSEIGRIVANESGLLYLDHEIIGEVARRLGVNIEQAARKDEKTIGMARHVLEALQTNSPFSVNLDTLLHPTRPTAQSQE